MPFVAPDTIRPQWRLFIVAYLGDNPEWPQAKLNLTNAALAAGYSPKGAALQGALILRKPQVEAVIRKELDARRERVDLHADLTLNRLLNELRRIAFVDVRKLSNITVPAQQETDSEDGKNRLSLEWLKGIDDDTAAAISEFRQFPDGRVQVKFYDRRQALTDLARHFGMRGAPQMGRIAVGVSVDVGAGTAPPLDLSALTRRQLDKLESVLSGIVEENESPAGEVIENGEAPQLEGPSEDAGEEEG